MVYSTLSLEEFYVDDMVLPNGQTVREFVMSYGSFGHIKTVGRLNNAIVAAGMRELSEEELTKARKPRLVDCNMVVRALRKEELSTDSEFEVMSKSKEIAEGVPTAYDKDKVLKKIGAMYPSIRTSENEEIFLLLDKVVNVVKSGGIE